MATMFYEMFWHECGSKNIDLDSKIYQVRKLCNLSLRIPYWILKEDEPMQISKIGHEFCQVPRMKCEDCKAFNGKNCKQSLTLTEMFAQLVPNNLCKTQGHTHLSKLTGTLLYVMHTEMFKEVKALAEEGKLTDEQIKILQRCETP